MATPKNIFIVLWLGMLSAAGCSIQQSQAVNSSSQQTQIVGWVENGKIAGVDKEVKVKLDTGAKTTSINAEILEKPDKETESGGTIRFRFLDGEGNKEVFERPIVRWVKIKSREGKDLRRPVVRMSFCIAGRWIEEEVNLADRDDFNYPVLIGRNMLKQGKLAVDSSQTFTTEPSCPKQEV
ncbi:ATP-dependent zinc protease [Chroococcidiopsis sp. FACHB-1243]|nr:ATP-dependent zinc protease [Chroococcidiopsis sp. [FACHB-1243]]